MKCKAAAESDADDARDDVGKPLPQIEVFRKIVRKLIRHYPHRVNDSVVNAWKMGQYDKAEQLLYETKLLNRRQHMSELTDGVVEFTFLQAQAPTQTARKLKKWDDVTEFAAPYMKFLKIKKRMLIRIFQICKRRRGWIIPAEFREKFNFEKLQNLGFFDSLYDRLDHDVIIRNMTGVQWHKVPFPAYMKQITPLQLKRGYIYSPLFEPEK